MTHKCALFSFLICCSFFNKGLGTACLSRSDAVRVLFQNTKKSSGGRNLLAQVKNVSETKLICYGGGESFDLDDVCRKFDVLETVFSLSTICTLENGQHHQVNL